MPPPAPPPAPRTEDTTGSVHLLTHRPKEGRDDNNNTPKLHGQGNKKHQPPQSQVEEGDSSEDKYKPNAILGYPRKRAEDRRERNGNSSGDDYKPEPVLDHPKGQATWARLQEKAIATSSHSAGDSQSTKACKPTIRNAVENEGDGKFCQLCKLEMTGGYRKHA